MLQSHNAPAIIIENAWLRYSNHILFENLNHEFPAGQTTCILGPSGVGKSSLLRLIAGIPPQDNSTHESVKVRTSDGFPLSHRIAYMAQTDLLLPWLSALQNVVIGCRLRGEELTLRRYVEAKKILVQLGLKEALRKRPAQLSGGMRQRVALARTLMENRPVVLMDEPFSSLDTVTRLRLQELASLLFVGRTVILITHDPLEAVRMGHQVIVMSGHPAQLNPAIQLPGSPPRSVTDDEILHWQGILMQQLLTAGGAPL